MNVRGRTVVVTGAGSGIGAAMARRFAADGATAVVLADIDEAAARAVVDGCRGPAGDTVGHAAQLDVADAAATAALVDAVETRHGAIGLYCANAGIGVARMPAESDPPDSTWQRLWDVHVMAHVHTARALLPRMTARAGDQRGWLLFTASAAGLLSQPDAPYAVTKHAAVAHAEWLAIRYGDRVGISCLCPGAVDTPMLRAESAERRALVGDGQAVISAEQAATAVAQGLDDERFLILTHPQVAGWMQHRAADPGRWIRGMRRAWRAGPPPDAG